MAKEMVYFNATKQIETITIHYNEKLDGSFVSDVCQSIKDIAKKMGSKVDLKNPREFYTIQAFIYPDKKMFYSVFGGEIEKRFYSRRRSLEDLYVVKDSDGNIHIVSPRGMDQEKRDAFKRILVIKVLGEYMEETEKVRAEKLLKESMKPKEEEIEESEEEIEEEEELEDIEEPEEEEEVLEESEEIEEDELTDEEVDEYILVQNSLADDENLEDENENKEENKQTKRTQQQHWLNIGWIAYVKGKLKKEKDIKRFAENISKKGIKKLGDLSYGKVFEGYNYSEEYACGLVDYIVTKYGTEKFLEYYNNPSDIQGVFGVSKFVFNNNVKAYIYSKYTDKEMKMEIDQKDINEVTEIHFTNSGVEIKSDLELEEQVQEAPKL